MGEDARWRGKGSSLGRRVNGEGSRVRGVEADAHRVPTVNVDYARALNLCAYIRERTLDLAFPKERIEKRPRRDRQSDKIRQNIFITAILLSPSRNLPASRVNALSAKLHRSVLINYSVLINEMTGLTAKYRAFTERLSRFYRG